MCARYVSTVSYKAIACATRATLYMLARDTGPKLKGMLTYPAAVVPSGQNTPRTT